jgi:uncharacterized membrane protein HdeD (DUF308 family)
VWSSGEPYTRPKEDATFVAPGTPIGQRLSRAAAEELARNWWVLLINGAVLVIVGFLIFSIDWTIRELATFIGAVFIFQGLATALTTGIDLRVRRANVVSGLLSAGAGIAIIVWPGPGLVAVAIFLAAFLVVSGTLSIAGAFAARDLLPNWWLLLVLGLLEISLGVLALANPGATLAALITVGGIWAVAVGVMRIVLAFEMKRLPEVVDEAWSDSASNGASLQDTSAKPRVPQTG